MKALGENPTEDELQNLINKFDDDGTGLIEFTEFLCLMATQAKEREQEELEGFIPFCFKAFADNVGSTLKVSYHLFLFKLLIHLMFPGVNHFHRTFQIHNAKST